MNYIRHNFSYVRCSFSCIKCNFRGISFAIIVGAQTVEKQKNGALRNQSRGAPRIMNENSLHKYLLHRAVAHPYYVYALLRGGEARAVGGVARFLRGGSRRFGSVLYAGGYVEEILPHRSGLVGIQALLRDVERAFVLVNTCKGSIFPYACGKFVPLHLIGYYTQTEL